MKKKIIAIAAVVCLSSCSGINVKRPFMCCVNTVENTLSCSQQLIAWDVISKPGTFCNVSADMESARTAVQAAAIAATPAKK